MKSPELAENVELTSQRTREDRATALFRSYYSRAFDGLTSVWMAKIPFRLLSRAARDRILPLLLSFPAAEDQERGNMQDVFRKKTPRKIVCGTLNPFQISAENRPTAAGTTKLDIVFRDADPALKQADHRPVTYGGGAPARFRVSRGMCFASLE
jgi:hypothetical protein